MPDHVLDLVGLRKTFGTAHGPVHAVDGVDLRIVGDEFFTMLGPSGCGKTTTLRMIAGLESITGGQILFDGADFSASASSRRNIGMVFQSYALFPHLTVFENAAYGMRVRNLPNAAVKTKVDQVLDMLGLGRLAVRYPADLSGGQQQRVSIARALAYDPRLLLLDEPLANLDAKLRVEMREEIRRIQKEFGVMTIFVTHDQEEALSVSDRLAVFSNGKIMQVGSGLDIYQQPKSLFVADFIGKANFFPARIDTSNGAGASAVLAGGARLAFSESTALSADEARQIPAGYDALVMARPERIELVPGNAGMIACTIKRMQFLGSFVRYTTDASQDAPHGIIIDSSVPIAGLTEGAQASVSVRSQEAHLFTGGRSA